MLCAKRNTLVIKLNNMHFVLQLHSYAIATGCTHTHHTRAGYGPSSDCRFCVLSGKGGFGVPGRKTKNLLILLHFRRPFRCTFAATFRKRSYRKKVVEMESRSRKVRYRIPKGFPCCLFTECASISTIGKQIYSPHQPMVLMVSDCGWNINSWSNDS